MSAAKVLLVVENSVKLNGDAYKKLSEAGYVIVRGDPSQFHVMEAERIASSNAILGAAFATLEVGWSLAAGKDIRARFAEELMKRINPERPFP